MELPTIEAPLPTIEAPQDNAMELPTIEAPTIEAPMEEDQSKLSVTTDKIVDGVSSKAEEFLTVAEGTKDPKYQEVYKTTMKTLSDERATNKAETSALDDEASAHRKQRFKDAPSMELEETMLPTFMTNRAYTTESMMGNFNKLKADGTVKNKREYYDYLKENGATPLDISNFSQASMGLTTSEEIFGKTIGEAPAMAKSLAKEHIAKPMERGATRTGLAMSSVLVDIAHLNPLISEDQQEQAQANLQEARAFIDAVESDYEQEYGHKSLVQSATESIPLVAMGMASPLIAGTKAVSWSKLAFADGAYEYMDSRGKGYSKIQAGAHGVIAAGVTKSLGKVVDLGTNVARSFKSRGKQLDEFVSIEDLPASYQKQIKQLQKQNGWTEEEVMSMVKGFNEGVEGGKLNAIDSIRLMAQNSHSPEARGAFKDTLLGNPKTARTFLNEATDRSKDVLGSVNMDSKLGKILHRNKLTKFGHTSMNWDQAYKQAVDSGINPNSTLMKTIKKNAEMFDDFDTGYHKALIKKGMGDTKTTGEEAKELAGDVAEIYLGKLFAKMTNTSYFAKMSIPKAMANFTKKMASPVSSKLEQTISQSIESGRKLNPAKIKEQIIKSNPNIPSDKIDEVIENILKHSQKSKREIIKEREAKTAKAEKAATQKKEAEDKEWEKLTTEEAEIKYRDIETDEKALRMEKTEVTKDLAAQEKAEKAKQLNAAKVNYRAKQHDLKKEQKDLQSKAKANDKAQLKVDRAKTKSDREAAREEKRVTSEQLKVAKSQYANRKKELVKAKREMEKEISDIEKARRKAQSKAAKSEK